MTERKYTLRLTSTGHRVAFHPDEPVKQTRDMPWFVWPFELAARIRAKMERKYG